MMMQPEPGDEVIEDFLGIELFPHQKAILDKMKTAWLNENPAIAKMFPKVPTESKYIEYSKADVDFTKQMYEGQWKEPTMDEPDSLEVLATELCEHLQTEQPEHIVFGVPVNHLDLTGSPGIPCQNCKNVINWLYGQNELHADHYNHPDFSVPDEVYDFEAAEKAAKFDSVTNTEATLIVTDGNAKVIKFDFTNQMFSVITKILDSGMLGVVNQTGKDFILKSEYMGTGYGYQTDLIGTGVPSKAAAYLGLLVSKVNTQLAKTERQVAYVKYARKSLDEPLVITMTAHKKPLKHDLLIQPGSDDIFKS